MPDFEMALAALEESLRHFGQNCKFQKTGSPNILCSTLPPHWRSNKSLPSPFMVILLSPVADGTKVTVTAGNEENDTADVKNHEALVVKQIARFSDLRFVGKSGRGKNFNLTITIHHADYREIAVVPSVIKVTVDGPRDSRNASKCHFNPFDFHHHRKRPAFNLASLNHHIGGPHSIPSTSGLFDLTNSSISGTGAKKPRLNNHNSNTVNNINNLQNPILSSNGNEFFKSQISMPLSSHPHHHQLVLPAQTPLILNPNLMMAAAAVMSQQQQHLHQHQQQQPLHLQQQNMYNAYLTLCAAALASSLNPPSSSDTSSECEDIKAMKKMSLESCKTAPETPPTTSNSPQQEQQNHHRETKASAKEKKVWRPFC